MAMVSFLKSFDPYTCTQFGLQQWPPTRQPPWLSPRPSKEDLQSVYTKLPPWWVALSSLQVTSPSLLCGPLVPKQQSSKKSRGRTIPPSTFIHAPILRFGFHLPQLYGQRAAEISEGFEPFPNGSYIVDKLHNKGILRHLIRNILMTKKKKGEVWQPYPNQC